MGATGRRTSGGLQKDSGAGVYGVEDLAIDIDSLMDAIELFAASNEGERLLRDGAGPQRDQVEVWTKSAAGLYKDRSAAWFPALDDAFTMWIGRATGRRARNMQIISHPPLR